MPHPLYESLPSNWLKIPLYDVVIWHVLTGRKTPGRTSGKSNETFRGTATMG